ncbi:hypothetical protein [Gilliamella sp. G0441]|uniref:hypothetical protein n=1 Tax=Gilliamella sp. G0441 TaxID=3384760 RepID=UPI003D3439E1
MKKRCLVLLSPILFVLGCSTTPDKCDPKKKDATIFEKIGCNYSGSYNTRIEEKQKILDNEKKVNQKFRDIYANIEKQKNNSSYTIMQKQEQLEQLKIDLISLTNEIKIKAKQTGRTDLQEKVLDIEQQQEKVSNSTSSETEKTEELDKLNKKLQQLQKSLNI